MPTTDHGPSSAAAPPPGCPAHNAYDLVELGLPNLDSQLAAAADGAPLTDPYADLRAQHGAVAPVLLPEVPPEVPVWLVLGWRENVEVARNQTAFTSSPEGTPIQRVVGPGHPLSPLINEDSMNFLDGTKLAELRNPLMEALGQFSRRGIRKLAERSAKKLINKFIERGHADLILEYTQPLPMMVLTRLLGLSDSEEEDEEAARLAADSLVMMSGAENAAESNAAVVRTLEKLVAARMERARFDLPSLLLTGYGEYAKQHNYDDEQLAHLVVKQLRLLIPALQYPTPNLIADTLRMLLADSRARADFRGGTMPVSEAVSRTMDDYPPMAAIPARYAREDTRLGGRKIGKGDMLLLGLAAGNTDPECRADLKVPLRDATLAGGVGAHACLGLEIGKAIAEIGCDVLLERIPTVELAAAPVREVAFISLALASLEVRFVPGEYQDPRDSRRVGATVGG